MKEIDLLKSNLEIAEIHSKRLKRSMELMKPFMPITAAHVEAFSEEQLFLIDFFVNRFAKLQDLLGNKLFELALKRAKEFENGMTFIDKVNRLEKLEVIPDANKWKDMRDMRNHISHEYPDKPDLTAQYLNEAYEAAPYLLECYENTKNFIERIDRIK